MKKVQFDYSELTRLIKYKFGSVKDFAEAIGLKDYTVYGRLNGKVEWGMSDMWSAINALEIPDGEISKYFFTLKG